MMAMTALLLRGKSDAVCTPMEDIIIDQTGRRRTIEEVNKIMVCNTDVGFMASTVMYRGEISRYKMLNNTCMTTIAMSA